ncbi:MAG: DeoR/GlpR transcriptional regulator [Verrucomicrobia bacterium]|nr:DeoR/GlpR transcriptional regulator [Verrucomicrobiota bacterium]
MTPSFSDRKKTILEILTEDGGVSVSALAQMLDVSVVTIRADLSALEEEGFIIRTHGGAMPTFHPQILERMRTDKERKTSIARAAAQLIQDGETVIISAGTTTALIPKYLLGRRNIHIVTNNTLLLTYARTNPQLRVTLVGGEFRPSEEGLVGPLTIQSLDQVFVSKAFIGVDGASVKQGFTAHLVESADLVRKMAEQAQQVFVICDSSKFGKSGFARILPFSGVDGLITDAALPPDFETNLRDAGVTIYKAEL